jgi:tetratricopeptide (TPR) repeat protein
VVSAIAPALERAEIERSRRKPTENLQAYDYYLRGLAALYKFTEEGTREALSLLQKAVELDPDFALPYAIKALCYIARKSFAWDVERAHEVVEAERVARLALALDRDDARVLTFAGHALRYVVGRPEEGMALLNEAVHADPNFAMGWAWRGSAKNGFGEAELAIKDFEHALRLNPRDPLMFTTQGQMAISHFFCGRYDEAISWAETSLRARPNHLNALRILMAAHALTGRIDAARQTWATYQPLDPMATLSNLPYGTTFGPVESEGVRKLIEGLRLAGMTE